MVVMVAMLGGDGAVGHILEGSEPEMTHGTEELGKTFTLWHLVWRRHYFWDGFGLLRTFTFFATSTCLG